MNEAKERELFFRELRNQYNFFVLAVIIPTAVFANYDYPTDLLSSDSILMAQSVAILLSLAAIPFCVQYLTGKMKRALSDISDTTAKKATIKRFSSFRLLSFWLVIVLDVLLFFFLKDVSFLLAAAMVVLASTLCMPTQKRLEELF